MGKPKFSTKVLNWFAKHGRKDLPWQQQVTPYKVWLSEIMLQQTQVATVIPYFKRFMKTFPSIKALAASDLDQVLHLWTGLGYYARARNLKKTAEIIVRDYHGRFPQDRETLTTLPGIGRSTAAAICALAFEQREAILDGNVKRVLCRYYAIDAWPDSPQALKALWPLAEKLLPDKQYANYTQAMMDLGALICTRTQAKCTECPLHKDCQAYQQDKVNLYPVKKPKTNKPIKNVYMLLLLNDNCEVYLEQRPLSGIWGGLWCFPELDNDMQATASKPLSFKKAYSSTGALAEDGDRDKLNKKNQIQQYCLQHFAVQAKQVEIWPRFRHTFTHYHLDITPICMQLPKSLSRVNAKTNGLWHDPSLKPSFGLAKPVENLLQHLGTFV